MSYKEFIEDCRRLMDRKGYDAILNAHLTTSLFLSHASGALQKWQMYNIALHNELVRIRAKNLGIVSDPFIHTESIDPSWAEPLQECIENVTPLRAEMHLLELQWSILERLQSGHQFDLDFLVVYALKLQLMERKASFNTERAMTRLETITSRIETHEQ